MLISARHLENLDDIAEVYKKGMLHNKRMLHSNNNNNAIQYFYLFQSG